MIQFDLLHSKYHLCSPNTRCLILSTYMKFVNLFPEIKQHIQDVSLKRDKSKDDDDLLLDSSTWFQLPQFWRWNSTTGYGVSEAERSLQSDCLGYSAGNHATVSGEAIAITSTIETEETIDGSGRRGGWIYADKQRRRTRWWCSEIAWSSSKKTGFVQTDVFCNDRL